LFLWIHTEGADDNRINGSVGNSFASFPGSWKAASLASTTMTSAGGDVCRANAESALRTRSGRFLVGMTTLMSTTQIPVLRGCTAEADHTCKASLAAGNRPRSPPGDTLRVTRVEG
jgi:hypothetical protein